VKKNKKIASVRQF